MSRKPKSQNRAQTELILSESSPDAARWLALGANGTYKKPSSVRVDVCKYIINKDLGMPRQKQELAGGLKLVIKWDGNRNATQQS